MKTNFKNNILTPLIIFCSCLQLAAQAIVINAPVPADNPNLAGTSPWTAICAGNGGFNEYLVNITWAGTANTNNNFILELSDASGIFDSASTLATVTDQNANFAFQYIDELSQNF